MIDKIQGKPADPAQPRAERPKAAAGAKAGPRPAPKAGARNDAPPRPARKTGTRDDATRRAPRRDGERDDFPQRPARNASARDDTAPRPARTTGARNDAPPRPARKTGTRDDTTRRAPRRDGERDDFPQRPARNASAGDDTAPRAARPLRTTKARDDAARRLSTDTGALAKASRRFPPKAPRGKGPAANINPHPAHAAAAEGKEPQRIAKLLARAGIASRREVERMITEGRVALNGDILTTPATLLPSLHGVTVDSIAVAAPAPARLFLFHKPVGYLTTERDPQGRPTIYDRLPADLPRVMPVGRLDMSTEGLLLLTTDGELKRQLELPATGVTRSYRARAFGEVSQAQLEELVMGVEIEGVRYGRIHANLERRTGRNQWIEMSLTEGKNREVRRVLEHLGLKVNRLIRTSYGPFALDDLPVGAVFEVREHDLTVFRNTLKKGKYDGDRDAS
ncbi:pseudouridine synthase [Sphingobium aquiterrae]|uniref:pseudouridine synthase n=1 Tax=Sphingobium aquiterrae TaxID=2038656 RepID=UPI003AFA886F